MESTIFKKMSGYEFSDGVYGLFGFAINDFKAKYNLANEDIKDWHVFGSVLSSNDITDDFSYLIKILNDYSSTVMMVFDIKDLSDTDIKKLIHIATTNGLTELEHVYADRIVFVRGDLKH